jgi:hypothetical protein
MVLLNMLLCCFLLVKCLCLIALEDKDRFFFPLASVHASEHWMARDGDPLQKIVYHFGKRDVSVVFVSLSLPEREHPRACCISVLRICSAFC